MGAGYPILGASPTGASVIVENTTICALVARWEADQYSHDMARHKGILIRRI
jgi:hypothetical protein